MLPHSWGNRWNTREISCWGNKGIIWACWHPPACCFRSEYLLTRGHFLQKWQAGVRTPSTPPPPHSPTRVRLPPSCIWQRPSLFSLSSSFSHLALHRQNTDTLLCLTGNKRSAAAGAGLPPPVHNIHVPPLDICLTGRYAKTCLFYPLIACMSVKSRGLIMWSLSQTICCM